MLRHRTIAREANQCGEPAQGPTRDTKDCNHGVACQQDVDCVFAQWSQWSACNRDCDGVRRRSRRIATEGRGKGKWCLGSTQETSPCNPAPYEAPLPQCDQTPKDCVFGDWDAWSACKPPCGGGQRRRERCVTQHASSGGAGCQGELVQIKACGDDKCPTRPTPVDCAWGTWSSWGACSKCGGQRTRFRQVEQESQNGGQACDAGPSEEIDDCQRLCHQPTFCVWTDWHSWGSCSQLCGTGGKRSRARELVLKSAAQVAQLGMIAAAQAAPGEAQQLGSDEAAAKGGDAPSAGAGGAARFLLGAMRLEVLAAFAGGYFVHTALRSAGAASPRDEGAGPPAAAAAPGASAGAYAPLGRTSWFNVVGDTRAVSSEGLLASWLAARQGGYQLVASEPGSLEAEA